MDPAFLEDFRHTIDRAAERLLSWSDADAGRQPAPGKWSQKEIIGHLIDSAANNHARFVRAQLQDDLVFPGYDQDAWVRLQRYRDRPWTDLVQLWRSYNHHIAIIMEAVDADALHVLAPGTTCISSHGGRWPNRRRRRSSTSCAITSIICSITCGRRSGNQSH